MFNRYCLPCVLVILSIILSIEIFSQPDSKKGSIFPPQPFELNAVIKNMPQTSGTLVTLDLDSNEPIYLDSFKTQKEKFTIKGKVEGARLYSILFNEKKRIDLFIEKGKHTLIGDWNDLSTAHVIGSAEDSAFRKYYLSFNKDTGINICMKMPDKAYAAFNIFYTAQFVPVGLDTLENFINNLTGNALASVYTNPLKNLLDAKKRTAIGAIAPDFSIPDTLGKKWSLKNFKGKFVFIDFWASWCKPCRELIPELKELHQALTGKNIQMIGISFDAKSSLWKNALRKEKMPWLQLSNARGWDEVSRLYGVRAIPQNFLIGPDGKILAVNITEGEILKQILEYLK